ncbi:MAG: nucleoside diphosphate kinase regulator [Myxococcales bacterium]|jgi:regulator of nucleoside diphosphate kinase
MNNRKPTHIETIYVTETDHRRLIELLNAHAGRRDADVLDQLEDELGRAIVVPSDQIPPNVVTMNSRIVFEDDKGQRREVSLVYPRDADPSSGKLSVLAPVGAALLGLSVGQTIEWPLPGDRTATLRIVSVLYQPEAAGDLHL